MAAVLAVGGAVAIDDLDAAAGALVVFVIGAAVLVVADERSQPVRLTPSGALIKVGCYC
jgi:uncharacterized membrane protein